MMPIEYAIDNKNYWIGLTPLTALIYISVEPAVTQNCVASDFCSINIQLIRSSFGKEIHTTYKSIL